MQGGVPVARLPLCCLLLMFLLAVWNAAGTEVESCLHVNTTLCVENSCTVTDNTTLLCCHLNHDFQLKEGVAKIAPKNTNIRNLYVYNASYDTLNVDVAKRFNFNVLSITGGKLNRIKGELSNTTVCLNFSGNSISSIDDNTFASLNEVRILDLSRNNLSSLPKSIMSIRNLTLDISENFKLWCTDVKSLLAPNRSDPVDFRNPNDTYCLANKTFHWFNSTDKYSLKAVEESIKVEQTCPQVCKCDAARTLFIGEEPSFTVMADCSNSNLTSLPPNLPQNTHSLNVSNNNITSLAALSTDPTYEGIRELDADNNFITSISELEGTKFISNFRVLSLQNNRIATVPTYFLTDTFSRNRALLRINLAGNKLSCECNTAQALKKWFLSNKNHIKDIDKVMCANLPIPILNVPPSSAASECNWSAHGRIHTPLRNRLSPDTTEKLVMYYGTSGTWVTHKTSTSCCHRGMRNLSNIMMRDYRNVYLCLFQREEVCVCSTDMCFFAMQSVVLYFTIIYSGVHEVDV